MLLRNDLLLYGGARPRTVRILWIDSGHSVAYTFELAAKGAQPELVAFPSLLADVQERRAQLLLIDPYRVHTDTAALPPKYLEVQARAWKIVEHLWSRLCTQQSVSLFCAYPKTGFTESAPDAIRAVCDAHSKLYNL